MGKKRIVKTEGEKETKEGAAKEATSAPVAKSSKKRFESGILYVQSTYNNTKVLVTDNKGNALFSSSSGALGFKGAKKGTPFAAAKVGEILSVKAAEVGMKEVSVIIKGVGSGREAAARSFTAKGINITSIKDVTPVPHNGPKPPKPRRV
jgi:small subunit ribosomal protein S11